MDELMINEHESLKAVRLKGGGFKTGGLYDNRKRLSDNE